MASEMTARIDAQGAAAIADAKTKSAEYRRNWRKAHPEKVCEYKRKYRQTHKEAERERRRKYRLAHKSELAEYYRKYLAAHPGLTREAARRYAEKHPLRNVWSNMLRRTGLKKCTNRKSLKRYEAYISRGITVCEEWRTFNNFETWAMNNGWRRGLEIDRIDNDGNYEPGNCRFVTRTQNVRNRRNSLFVVYNGTRMSLAEAMEISKCGLCYKTVFNRIARHKWTTERALTEPAHDAFGKTRGGVA